VTGHEITVADYGVLLLAAVGLHLSARDPQSRIPSLREVSSRVLASKSGRIAALAAWAWLGMHFFAV
jgi:hypothetical protein